MNDKVHLNLKFSGAALEQGAMDIRDLAPALLGLGNMFDSANTILNGSQEKIGVEIKATSRGSFSVDFNVYHVLSQAITLLNSPAVIAGVTAATIISMVIGVLKFIQLLGNKKISKVESINNQIIIYVDNLSYTLSIDEYKLFQDFGFREAVNKAIAEPLLKDGIEELYFASPTLGEVTIEKNEASYFITPKPEGETLVEEVIVKAFSIVSLTFKEDNKWRLSDGNATISVLIQDLDFIQKIDLGEKFGKNDVLLCEVKVTQRQTPEGIKTDYIVLKVREHKPAARQMIMDLKG